MRKYILTSITLLPLLLTVSHAAQKLVGRSAGTAVGFLERRNRDEFVSRGRYRRRDHRAPERVEAERGKGCRGHDGRPGCSGRQGGAQGARRHSHHEWHKHRERRAAAPDDPRDASGADREPRSEPGWPADDDQGAISRQAQRIRDGASQGKRISLRDADHSSDAGRRHSLDQHGGGDVVGAQRPNGGKHHSATGRILRREEWERRAGSFGREG